MSRLIAGVREAEERLAGLARALQSAWDEELGEAQGAREAARRSLARALAMQEAAAALGRAELAARVDEVVRHLRNVEAEAAKRLDELHRAEASFQSRLAAGMDEGVRLLPTSVEVTPRPSTASMPRATLEQASETTPVASPFESPEQSETFASPGVELDARTDDVSPIERPDDEERPEEERIVVETPEVDASGRAEFSQEANASSVTPAFVVEPEDDTSGATVEVSVDDDESEDASAPAADERAKSRQAFALPSSPPPPRGASGPSAALAGVQKRVDELERLVGRLPLDVLDPALEEAVALVRLLARERGSADERGAAALLDRLRGLAASRGRETTFGLSDDEFADWASLAQDARSRRQRAVALLKARQKRA